MESLKQFRVNFQVTFWCEGRKGIFSKKPYKFTVSFCDDIMLSTLLQGMKLNLFLVKWFATGQKKGLRERQEN